MIKNEDKILHSAHCVKKKENVLQNAKLSASLDSIKKRSHYGENGEKFSR